LESRTEPADLPKPADNSIRYIPLAEGKHAIVDAADFEWLSQYRWHVCRRGYQFYAWRWCNGHRLLMHREIMKTPPGMVVDHINGNGLDQRRRNMRNCTQEQNLHNAGPRGGVSGFKGVYRYGNRWCAQIEYHGEKIIIGVFDDPVEAAKARDRKAAELFGEYAWLNFPEDAEKYKSDIANCGLTFPRERGRIADCGLNQDAGGEPRAGGPSKGGDTEPRVTTAYRSRRASKWQPSPRSSTLTLPPGWSRLFAAARLAGRALRRHEMCLRGCDPLGRANTLKTATPAPGGYGPRMRVPLRRPPLFVRGPPWMLVALFLVSSPLRLTGVNDGECRTKPWQDKFEVSGWHGQAQLDRVFLGSGRTPSEHGQTSLAVPPGSPVTFLSCTHDGTRRHLSLTQAA